MSRSWLTLARMVWRYATARRINLFAVILIVFALTALVTVNAVMKGFGLELENLIRGSLSDYQIEWPEGGPALAELDRTCPPEFCYSPVMERFGLLKTNYQALGIAIKGVDPGREAALRALQGQPDLGLDNLTGMEAEESSPVAGLSALFSGAGEAVESPCLIGALLADQLAISVGDRVEVLLPDYYGELGRGVFRVTGIFRSGFHEDDRRLIYIPLEEAQSLLKSPGKYSHLQLAARTPTGSAEVRDRLTAVWPEAEVLYWEDLVSDRLRAIRLERRVMAIILSLVVVVAGFSILAIQWNFVTEKKRDIGILRAMGFGKNEIFFIFLGVSWLVGLIGLIFGLAGGIGLSLRVNEVIALTGLDPLPRDLYYHEGLPVAIELLDLFWMGLLSMSITTLAGFIPAWKALRVQPIEAIRKG